MHRKHLLIYKTFGQCATGFFSSILTRNKYSSLFRLLVYDVLAFPINALMVLMKQNYCMNLKSYNSQRLFSLVSLRKSR